MESIYTLTAVGLAYDGIGVAILGFAFFAKSIKAMMIESGTYFGGNNALLESLIQTRTDGVTGTTFLILGFLFQWLGSIGISDDNASKILLGILIFSLLLYVVYLRKKIIGLQVTKGEALRREHLGEE